MAVHPLELRPRSATALMDAAVRLCLHSSGVWLLVAPGVLAVTAALLFAWGGLEHGSYLPASIALAAAWVLRAMGQGAASHHLRGLLLEERAAPLATSLKAALYRLPTLVYAATWMSGVRWGLALVTLGISLLLSGAPGVLYAVAIQRTGPLRTLGQASRELLGSSRSKATVTQLLLGFQLLLALNLHVLVTTLLSLGRSLLALDVAWLLELTSARNPDWVLLLCAVVFGAFEPLRAALATLLLLDARVRRDGVDLLARLEALPARRQGGSLPASAAGWVGLVLLPLLTGSGAAHARAAPTQPRAVTERMAASGPARATPATPSTSTSAVEASAGQTSAGQTSAVEASAIHSPMPIGPSPLPGGGTEAPIGDTHDPIASIVSLTSACGEADAFLETDAQRLRGLRQGEGETLARWANRLEQLAAGDAGCAVAMEQLRLDTWVARDGLDATMQRSPDAALSAILARPEFAHAGRTPTDDAEASTQLGWFQRLAERLAEWLDGLFKERKEPAPLRDTRTFLPSGGGAFASSLYWVLIAGCVVVVVLLLLRALRGPGATTEVSADQRVEDAEGGADRVESALSKAPTTWISLADQLAAEGRYRDAVRHVYLALLSGLHARGAIHYDPNASNWDYLGDFRGTSEQRSAFRELTLRFDFAWYGFDPVRPEAWVRFREGAVSLLPTQGGARRA